MPIAENDLNEQAGPMCTPPKHKMRNNASEYFYNLCRVTGVCFGPSTCRLTVAKIR